MRGSSAQDASTSAVASLDPSSTIISSQVVKPCATTLAIAAPTTSARSRTAMITDTSGRATADGVCKGPGASVVGASVVGIAATRLSVSIVSC